ncbi:MAG: DNA gyrase modulator [Caulobacteraceae bacterium]
MDENLLEDVVAAALKAGADAAEAVSAERQSLSVQIRAGILDELEREESRDLGVRVFVGQRQASVSGSDVSAEGRRKLVERVVAMARLAPEDPYAGLAPADRLATGPLADLDLFDPSEPPPRPGGRVPRGGGRRRRHGRRDHPAGRRRLVVVGLAHGHQRRLLRRAPRHRLQTAGPRPSPRTRPAWSRTTTAAPPAGARTCCPPTSSARRPAGARPPASARARSRAPPRR